MKAALRAGLCAVVATALLGTAAAKVAPFREGDRVMFLGDSITHGGWYVAYLQYIWCLRNPGKRITLLNGGICGNTAAEGLSRFDWDIAPEKPNRVFIMFGMNDVGHGAFWDPASTAEKDLAARREKVKAFRTNMKALVAKCRAIGAEVTLVTPTPYDEYSPLIEKKATKGVNDPGLRTIADATRALAAEEKLECVDLYGPLTPILRDHPEVKFLVDRVHPHDDGHLLMAALVLDAMDFPATVDGATFDASKGERRFTYSPKALPFPVNDHYRSDDTMYPLTEKFNREIIRVTGLPAGLYALKAAGRTIGCRSADDLERGVNVATLDTPSQRRAGEGVGKVAAPLKKLAGSLRGLPQGYVQVTKRGGDINDQASCFAKLDEWIEELRKANAAGGHYYRYYGGEVKAFKALYPRRDAEKARLEKLREDIFDWCRPEPFEISVEPMPEATVDRGGVTFDFRRLSDEAFASGLDARTPGSNELAVCLSPHDCLGNDFAVPRGQCGTLGLNIRNGKDAKWHRKDLCFRLTLPPGFELLGVTFGDLAKGTAEKVSGGAVAHTFPIRGDFSVNWTQYHRLTALVRANGRVGTEGMATFEALRHGKPCAKAATFRLFTVPAISSVKPRRYMNGLYSSGVSAYFYGEERAERAFAQLLDAAGVQWMIPDRSDPKTVSGWRRAGVKRLTPPIGICNGYMIPAAKEWADMPAEDRFVATPAKGDFQKGFDGLLATMGVCPFAVIDERPYFVSNIVRKCIAEPLKGMDGSWANWEPHMFEDRGCDCARCRAEFAKWRRANGDDVHMFRSWVHGRYVRTLDRYVRKFTGGERSVGFIPGVCWRACTTAWREKLFSKEYRPVDYVADVEWFDPWGPYVYWDAEKPLGKSEREPLWHWFFAKDMREQADRFCGDGRKVRLLAFPHAQQGRSWVTQPEHLGMAMDAFFFNRWEATVAYFFPQGCDARYWRAFADATRRAALCERWVWDGRRSDAQTAVETVPEFAPPRKLVSDYVPSSTNASCLQTASYDRFGVRLVAALNSCDFAPAYFTLKAEGLPPVCTVVDEDGVSWFRGDVSKGAFLMVGAARTKAFFLVPDGASAGPVAVAALTQERLRADYAAQRAALRRSVVDGLRAGEIGTGTVKPKNLID